MNTNPKMPRKRWKAPQIKSQIPIQLTSGNTKNAPSDNGQNNMS